LEPRGTGFGEMMEIQIRQVILFPPFYEDFLPGLL
jgi:hypothetical protein